MIAESQLQFLSTYYLSGHDLPPSIISNEKVRIDLDGLLYLNEAPIPLLQRLLRGQPRDACAAKAAAVYQAIAPLIKAAHSFARELFGSASPKEWSKRCVNLSAAHQQQALMKSEADWPLYKELLEAVQAGSVQKRYTAIALCSQVQEQWRLCYHCVIDIRDKCPTEGERTIAVLFPLKALLKALPFEQRVQIR